MLYLCPSLKGAHVMLIRIGNAFELECSRRSLYIRIGPRELFLRRGLSSWN